MVAAIAHENAHPACIDNRIIGNQTLTGGLIVATLPLGHSKKQSDPRPVAIHHQVVFDDVTRPANSNSARSTPDEVFFDQAIRAAARNQLSVAATRDVTAVNIPRAFIADDLSFPVAAIENVFLHNRADFNVPKGRLIRSDLDRLPSTLTGGRNAPERIMPNDVSVRDAVFINLLIDMQIHTTRCDIRETTIRNLVILRARRDTYYRPSPSAVLEHAIYDPAML